MRKTTAVLTTVAILLVASTSVQAHLETRSANAPTGPLVPGTEYSVDLTAYVHCSVVGPTENDATEYHDGQTLTLSIANAVADVDDYQWLNASMNNATINLSECSEEGSDVGIPGPKIILEDTVTFTVDSTAPAFTTFNFQPGAIGESNQGGNFSAHIAYNPAFTVPTAAGFDVNEGGATATIPLTMQANADSVFSFDVTSFTIDGEAAPESATAHIQDSLELETGIFSEEGTASTTVDLHFGVGTDDHEDHDAMEGMEDDDTEHDDQAVETAFVWETAQVALDITLAAQEDPAQVSEPQTIVLTFTNTDHDSMPHEHDEELDGDGGNLLPGFEAPALLAALGAVALLRRRS